MALRYSGYLELQLEKLRDYAPEWIRCGNGLDPVGPLLICDRCGERSELTMLRSPNDVKERIVEFLNAHLHTFGLSRDERAQAPKGKLYPAEWVQDLDKEIQPCIS